MNVALTADDAKLTLMTERIEGVLSFLISRSKDSARSLSPSISDVFNGCVLEVNRILQNIIQTRTREEYRREFQGSFGKYVGLTLAMSHFASAVVPKDAAERLTRESICEMEADFRDDGLAAFGAAVRNQALFTVWTLRKINELLSQIVSVKLEPGKKKEDFESCAKFNVHVFRAQFSLDCLILALKSGQAVYPDILEELTDDLRSMVNAYAWARRGLEARVPTIEPILNISPMDDEDRGLLEVSMSEAATFSDESM